MENDEQNKIELIDIADNLLIVNKTTIERLFQLDNASDCIALYMFYYKTAKWQKTNQIKANDLYVKKCLKWGSTKIRNTKDTLIKNGLIEKVQVRKNNKIAGWYIKVHYIVCENAINGIQILRRELQHSKRRNSKYNI